MDDFTSREKKIFLGMLCLVGAIFVFFMGNRYRSEEKAIFALSNSQEITSLEENQEDSLTEGRKESIYIHISGAVNQPGILELKPETRLVDAIQLAGGATSEADLDKINLSRKLHDEEKIHIPKYGELEETNQAVGFVNGSGSQSVVNINTGTKEQLTTLPGVGEKTAEKIIRYREEHPFQQVEDLKEVPGIGEKKFEELKNNIQV
ncbi:helix-hairpin-helix domain-containing protein [Peptoniphilus sp. KCTC 25270]|uniref:DUF655 domain-containing protein n=1 Tax=Peptoniphilus sp. KCTC 25270 TaxID=2897414 RepID=UPI001E295664|nr:DUF655 domain-containing protein [Peptoniphilus sp. KCTC 25270]MCD1146927.1 helix-hairpin-helix domain-containing protein [Peptoniphilus sp. KCTC 25270]